MFYTSDVSRIDSRDVSTTVRTKLVTSLAILALEMLANKLISSRI
jgi:hypothetical protein